MLGLCGAHVGNILGPCWLYVGCVTVLGLCWAMYGPMLRPCWACTGPVLRHVGSCGLSFYVGPMLGPFWDHIWLRLCGNLAARKNVGFQRKKSGCALRLF